MAIYAVKVYKAFFVGVYFLAFRTIFRWDKKKKKNSVFYYSSQINLLRVLSNKD